MIDNRKEFLFKEIISLYPNVRHGFLEIILIALEIHDKKNHDYNGEGENMFDLGLQGRFHDINRKFSRLYHLLHEKRESLVIDENLEDTAIDLGNYAFLLAEKLRELMNKN